MARIHRRTVQKGLNDLDNQSGVITHSEPDILEYKVKRAFRSDEHKEIEENNRMGKTRDLVKKISDSKDGLSKGQKWYGPNRSNRY